MLEIKSLFEVVEKTSNTIIIKLSNSSHPVFKAHFPNNPILPGFCHIEILSTLLKDNITKVKLLKLHQKALPNDTITYKIQTKNNQKTIKILNTNTTIGKLQYEY